MLLSFGVLLLCIVATIQHRYKALHESSLLRETLFNAKKMIDEVEDYKRSHGSEDENLHRLGLHIAACSYEGSLFGWDAYQNKTTTSELRDQEGLLSLKFGFHCSAGSLRAIAVSRSGKFLVCGGMDERIRIFDLKLNKSLGELSQHTGYVFISKSFHLIRRSHPIFKMMSFMEIYYTR